VSDLSKVNYLLQFVVENSPARIFWKDLDLRYLGCNTQFAKDAGFSRPDEVIGKSDFEMGWKEQAELYRADDLEVIKSGIPRLNFEERQTTPEGKQIWLNTSKVPLRDEKNQIIGLLGNYEDKTARKVSEDALLHSKARLNATLDAIPALLFEVGLDGTYYKYHSPRKDKSTLPPQDLIGKRVSDVMQPEAAAIVMNALQQAKKNNHASGIQIAVDKPQGKCWFELSIARKEILFDEDDHFIVISHDITARKKAEEALLKAGALQKAIFDSAYFSCIATDGKGVIQIFNVGAESMLGYTAAEVLNKTTPAEISDPEELVTRAKELSLEMETPIMPGFDALVFKASRGIEDIYDLTYIRKDGSRLPAVVSVTALRDEQDTIIGYLLIGTDNTASKQIEADKEKLNQHLQDYQFYTRSLFESNIDAMITSDTEGIITDINKQVEILTEWSRDELIGSAFKNYFTDPEKAEVAIEQVLRKKKITNYELSILTVSGKETQVSLNATTLYDRKRRIKGVLISTRDITEHKRQEKELNKAKEIAEKINLIKGNLISKNKLVEDKLRETTDRLMLASRAGGVGIWDYDLIINRVIWDDQMYLLYGTDRDQFSDAHEAFKAVLHPDDLAGSDADMQLALNGKKNYDTEFRVIWQDGTIHFIRALAFVERNDSGQPIRMIGTNWDISDLKRTEALLRENEERFRSLADNISQMAWMADAQGSIFWYNKRWFDYTGTTLEETQGWGWQKTLHPDHVQRVVEKIKHCFETGLVWEDTFPLRGVDGQYRWFLSRALPIRDAQGVVLRWFGTKTDITEQKLAEMLMQDTSMRLQSIFSSAVDGIITIDASGKVETFNPASERIFDYTASEVIGQNVKMLMPEPYHGEHDGYLGHYLTTGKAGIIGSGRSVMGQRKDGSTFPMSLAVSEMTQKGQRYFIGIVRDVTKSKNYEDKLIEAKEVAENANQIKTSFLATMSHEIRTPLGGMLGMLELLSMTNLDAEQVATLDTAWASGRSLLRIVNDILDWSKVEEGKLEISPTPTLLKALLLDVVNTYSRVASAKSLRVWEHVDSRLVNAYMVDQLRLSQVLNNFVSNAIKFTDRGEIEIRAELLESGEQGDLIRFSVKDTGIGIAKADQVRMFQNYTQASAETARMYGGTGLGLAISRRLSEMMHGQIGLVSELKRGSTFSITLTLPRTDAVAEMLLTKQYDVAQRRIKPLFNNGMEAPHILVADDHPTNRELLARQIKILGLRATTAEDGRVGVSLWRDVRFAMIITDCHMPNMDGYELAKAIRKIEAIEGRGRTPIIAWTANALDGERALITAAGMDELLIKPVDMNSLRRMLAQWLKPEALFEAANADQLELIPAQTCPIDYEVLGSVVPDKAEQTQILHDLLAHVRTDRFHLGDLLAQADTAAAQSCAHRMKGSCRMVGATRLGEACSKIEQEAQQGNLATTQVSLAELDEAFAELEKFIG
jgi:PAS domain S-box-containing protein